MYLQNENHEIFDGDDNEKITERYFWMYDVEKRDFFLRTCPIWFNVKSEMDKIQIGNDYAYIPSNYFILIGDYDVGLDIISPEEIVGREFLALTLNHKFSYSSFNFSPMNIVGHTDEKKFVFPLTSNLIPIMIGNKVILVASKNIYSNIKNLSLSDFM